MLSTFTWLDSSEHDRQRAMEVIDLFRRQDTRDELGIGSVRDALAGLLAPGISTIQTRARYFLIVPWIYQRLEGKQVPSAAVAGRARDDELRIAAALGRSSDREGAIGIEAGRTLQRLPSEIYWAGLAVLGIRLFSGSQDQYHRSLDRLYRETTRTTGLREDRESEFGGRPNWHPHVPPPPEGFREALTFAVTLDEARYLRDRLQQRVPDSLLAFLVRRGAPFASTQFAWDEPLLSSYPEPLRTRIEHARGFSEVMHGAALLYNLMLAEARRRDDWIARYRDLLGRWRALMATRAAQHELWDRTAFWALVSGQDSRIPFTTRTFATRWMELARREDPLEREAAAQRTLILDREVQLKRGRARLQHAEYLQMWGGAAGADALDYRWPTTQTVASDILRGLQGEGVDAGAA